MSDASKTIMFWMAMAVALGFVYCYGRAIFWTWRLKGSDYLPGTAHTLVATALAGVVGTVFATSFGQKLEKPAAADARPGVAEVADQLARPGFDGKTKDLVVAIYLYCYFTVGLACIATWIKFDPKVPEMVKNLAGITLGITIAAVTAATT